nr:UDP-N-acetylmuramate dehydrogenase [Clostridia bacterium]
MLTFNETLKLFGENNIYFEQNKSLAECSTFRIGGKVKAAVYPESDDAFKTVLGILSNSDVRHIVFGNCSNVLFDDRGYDGIIVFTAKMSSVKIDGTTVIADAGVPFTQLAAAAQRESLTGLEFAYGIPGTVGGAVFMNAGAYDGETSGVLEWTEYCDPKTGSINRIENAAHDFSYRHSIFMENGCIILRSAFALKKGDRSEIKSKMDGFMTARRDKQPLEYPSAGSTFKRYPGYFTAKLIDEAGLKGFSVGGAQVSEKHAGFIINKGNATSADVMSLIDVITEKIRENHGITIEREVRYLPYDGDGVI